VIQFWTEEPFDRVPTLDIGGFMSFAPDPERWRPDALDGLITALLALTMLLFLAMVVRMYT